MIEAHSNDEGGGASPNTKIRIQHRVSIVRQEFLENFSAERGVCLQCRLSPFIQPLNSSGSRNLHLLDHRSDDGTRAGLRLNESFEFEPQILFQQSLIAELSDGRF